MGFNFVTSPDNLESPNDAACICLGNSLVTKSETESPPKSLSIMAPMLKTAAAAISILCGNFLLLVYSLVGYLVAVIF